MRGCAYEKHNQNAKDTGNAQRFLRKSDLGMVVDELQDRGQESAVTRAYARSQLLL